MPSNVEVKARVDDVEELKLIAQHLSGTEPTVIPQEDIFFNAPNGRLKLRRLQHGVPSQLIFYDRKDDTGPKVSDYHIAQVTDPEGIQITLGKAMGIKGDVKKTRFLYMVGQTRVHVDEVEGLGNFMELEVVLKDGQSVEEGQAIAENLIKQLGVKKENLITGAYMDMLAKK